MTIDKQFERLKLEYDESVSLITTLAVIGFSILISMYALQNSFAKIIFFILTLVIMILFFIVIIKKDRRYDKLHQYLTK